MPEENNTPPTQDPQPTPKDPVDTSAQTVAQQPIDPQIDPTKKSNKKAKLAAIIFGVVVLLAALSAGVVFGYILPNQPENVLKTAVVNTAQQTKISYSGVINYEFTDDSAPLKALKIELSGQADNEVGAYQATINITGSGVTLPIEVRVVDNSLFFKLGDLSTIQSLANASVPYYTELINQVNTLLADQWVEVDDTLLKQAGLQCSLSDSFALTDADIQLLEDRYKAVPFTEVTSTTSEQLDGRDTYKYNIAIDDDKGAEYLKGLQELSVVKKLQECSDQSAASEELNTSELADGDTTPITIWVDKDTKTISQIASESTQQDLEESGIVADLQMSFSYGQANIEKPTDAIPAAQLFADLQQIIYGDLSEDFGTLGDTDEPQLLPGWFDQL